MLNIIIDSKPPEPITVTRQGHYVVQHQSGETQVIHTAAHVTFKPVSAPAQSYQQQIDNLAAQLPARDTTTIADTDYLANYLLHRGQI